jgi:arsenical pump membrane protein
MCGADTGEAWQAAAMHFDDAFQQAWPAFVLVTGLLLVGLVAHSDGLFARAGALLERLPGPPSVLLIAGMALVAVVTAVLNLDTSVVFMTPVLVYAARHRGIDEEPFLYSAIFMANASSLYLLGSNLTNLLVLSHAPISGGEFARGMFVPALVATLTTALGLLLLFRRRLGLYSRSSPPTSGSALVPNVATTPDFAPMAGAARSPRSSTSSSAPVRSRAGIPRRRAGDTGLGLTATFAAALLTVTLRQPALPVLGVGLLASAVQLLRGNLSPAEIVRAVGPAALAGLFALSVLLGALARSWDGPAQLLAHAGRWGTAAIGAGAAVAINNLPAAVLLSARPLAHPRALLLGLNLGPNLAVTGSLSAYLWLKVSGRLGAHASARAFTRRGVVLAPLALVGALLAAGLLGTPG